MKSPINWYGGKFYMRKELLPIIAKIPHTTYCEVFGGAAHVLFAKPPSKVDVYNDINEGLVNFFEVLRNQPNELRAKLELTPYARTEFEKCRNWVEVTDPLEQARQFFTACLQSYANGFETWGYSKKTSRGHKSSAVNKWLNKIDYLPQVVDRLRAIQIENLDFERFITKYDDPQTVFYLDPPYLPKTRERKNVYAAEMSYADHERLVGVLKTIKGKAILSGYNNTLYDELGWRKQVLQTGVLWSSRLDTKNTKDEIVWLKTV